MYFEPQVKTVNVEKLLFLKKKTGEKGKGRLTLLNNIKMEILYKQWFQKLKYDQSPAVFQFFKA